MKVLHIVPFMAQRYGGSNKAVMDYCIGLSRYGIDTTIYTTNIDGKDKLKVPLEKQLLIQGVKIWYFSVQTPRYFFTSFPLAEKLRREIKNFDIVHITSIYSFSALIGAYYCQKYNIPYIINVAGDLNPHKLNRHFIRKIVYMNLRLKNDLKKARMVHFTNIKEWKNAVFVKSKIKEVIINRCIVSIPISLKYESPLRISTGKFRKLHPQLADNPIILYLGRINYVKGLDNLCRAFIQVLKQRQNAWLVLAGPDDGNYLYKLKKQLKKGNVLDNVIFTGPIYDNSKNEAMLDADIFVLPSYSENFGISAFEAMSFGLPVILSDKADMAKELADVTMVVDCSGDQLTEAIIKLIDNKELRKKLGSHAKQYVKKYSIDIITKKLIKTYQSAIEQNNSFNKNRMAI